MILQTSIFRNQLITFHIIMTELDPRLRHTTTTYLSLQENLENWNIRSRIAEKYSIWQLRHPQPVMSEHWLGLIRHSILFYIVDTLPWLLQDRRNHYSQVHSEEMKFHYCRIMMEKPTLFDLKMVVLIKIVTYFIISQFPDTLADNALEADIYRVILQTIIGLQVELKAYDLVLKGLQKKDKRGKNRDSVDSTQLLKGKEPPQSLSIGKDHVHISLKTIGRRHARKHNQYQGKLWEIKEQYTHLQEIGRALKQNLSVKPAVKPKTPKFTIQQLKSIEEMKKKEEYNFRPQQQRDTTSLSKQVSAEGTSQVKQYNQGRHPKIASTQMSQAMSLNTQIKLIDIKNFSIHHSARKNQQHFQKLPSIASSLSTLNDENKRLLRKIKKVKAAKVIENSFLDAKTQKSPRQDGEGKVGKADKENDKEKSEKWFKMLAELKQKTYKLNKNRTSKQTLALSLQEKYKDLFRQSNSMLLQSKFITEIAREATQPTNPTTTPLNNTADPTTLQQLAQSEPTRKTHLQTKTQPGLREGAKENFSLPKIVQKGMRCVEKGQRSEEHLMMQGRGCVVDGEGESKKELHFKRVPIGQSQF